MKFTSEFLALKLYIRQLKFYVKFYCNYLPVDVNLHRNYWTICEELLLFHLTEIILT